jgi:hypothetical protein
VIWAELNPRLKNATWYFSVPKSLMKGIPLFIPNSLRSKAMVAFDLADACPVVSPICNSNQQQGCQCWESDVTSQFGSCVARKKRAPGLFSRSTEPLGRQFAPNPRHESRHLCSASDDGPKSQQHQHTE